jgi:hypothetical protein
VRTRPKSRAVQGRLFAWTCPFWPFPPSESRRPPQRLWPCPFWPCGARRAGTRAADQRGKQWYVHASISQVRTQASVRSGMVLGVRIHRHQRCCQYPLVLMSCSSTHRRGLGGVLCGGGLWGWERGSMCGGECGGLRMGQRVGQRVRRAAHVCHSRDSPVPRAARLRSVNSLAKASIALEAPRYIVR